jgi:hypothetical protein
MNYSSIRTLSIKNKTSSIEMEEEYLLTHPGAA